MEAQARHDANAMLVGRLRRIESGVHYDAAHSPIAPLGDPSKSSAKMSTLAPVASAVTWRKEGQGGQLTVEMPSGTSVPAEGAEVAVVWPRAESRVFAREAP